MLDVDFGFREKKPRSTSSAEFKTEQSVQRERSRKTDGTEREREYVIHSTKKMKKK